MGRRTVRIPDAELLRTPFRALRIRIDETPLGPRVERLWGELEAKGIAFRPHVWFSSEWFSPDGVAGIAVPFYLANERLARLERRQHHQCEGWNELECLRLLRHEAGHALDTAYGLARRPEWRALFGKRGAPYRKRYRAHPGSESFVRHLPRWYAQSHPAEDFAETFAVWLARGTRGAPPGTLARRKLEYVAECMAEFGPTRPRGVLRERPYSLASIEETLGDHYARRRREQAREPEPVHGAFLDAFATPARNEPTTVQRNEVAAHLTGLAPAVRRALPLAPAYDVDQVLDGLRLEARRRDLRWRSAKRPAARALAGLVQSCWSRLRRGSALLAR